MASIKAKLSSIELYQNQCNDNYSTIRAIANDVLSRTEKLYYFVEGQLEKISRQLIRVQKASDEISYKAMFYSRKKEEAEAEINLYDREIDYIRSHPTTVTKTDDEGNETTEEVVDYAAIHNAQRERDSARSTRNLCQGKLSDARIARIEAESMLNRFQYTKRGIEAVSRSIQNDIYEIRKYINSIENEAEFNIHSLQEVIDSLQSYLASKAIYMPEGSYYEEYASHTIYVKSEKSSVDVDESALYKGTSGENIENHIDQYENSETYISALKYAGVYGDYETQNKMVTVLKDVINNSSLSMRVERDILFSKILVDGKFKNFFETGKSNGVVAKEDRIESSKYCFGTDKKIDGHGFEKFGYLDANGHPEKMDYPLGQYGGVIVNFKKETVNATFTCGDSLGFYQHSNDGGIGCPINNPSLCAMNKYQLKILGDLAKKGVDLPQSASELSHILTDKEKFEGDYQMMGFIEVQYHGDLDVKDIDSITFIDNYGTPTSDMINTLNNLGIKYNICHL